MTSTPILQFDSARISYFIRAGEANVIPDLSFSIAPNEALGLVGESGCGKSTVALAVMQYLGRAGRVTGGRILFEGKDLAQATEQELRQIRGRRIAMVYQDPMSSLNPVMQVGRQLMEVPMIHDGVGEEVARARSLAMLREVKLPDPEQVMQRYPHQLSGGQQQRIVIAMALIAQPALLIMDEPTTGLDVTVEAAVLDLVRELRTKHRSAILFISHNLGTVAHICDRIGVMYGGELVEEGPIRSVFANPSHPYTRGLLDCLPTLGRDKHGSKLKPIQGQVGSPLKRPPGCQFANRCAYVEIGRCTTAPIPSLEVTTDTDHVVKCVRWAELPPRSREAGEGAAPQMVGKIESAVRVEHLRMYYKRTHGLFNTGGQIVRAVNDVELVADRGRTLAIVGESGCGKSTLAKVLAGLETATDGDVTLSGQSVGHTAIEDRKPDLKRKLQMVFQNPDSTLNPSHTVGYAIGRALKRLKGVGGAAARAETERLLEIVKLPAAFADHRPHQLSGGQKQRVAIARALAGDAEVLVADEPVSALDVSVQASIINLLNELQTERDATLVFISHNLAVVRYLADRVAVMYLGKVVEYGPVDAVFKPPFHPYTEALLSAVPQPDPDASHARIVLEGSPPSPTAELPGCVFASRCPRKVGEICDTTPPPEHALAGGHRIACHIPVADLVRLNAVG